MSALDQAFIKAYAKDRPAAAPLTTGDPSAPLRPEAARQSSAHPIEQLYHDGALYRVETRAASARVPASHLPSLPPTSPRRAVRRSMLRLQAASAAASEPEKPAESPRVARKVIIRHISHPSAPPPLGPWRPTVAPTTGLEISRDAGLDVVAAELPPETILDEPTPSPTPTPLPTPLPPAPQVAPLNVALETSPPIEVHRHWDLQADIAPLVVLTDAVRSHDDVSQLLVTVQLDALAAAEEIARAYQSGDPNALAHEESTTPFATKSLSDRDEPLSDREEPQVAIRVDEPHAQGRHRPHARFGAVDEPATAAIEPARDERQTAPEPVSDEELTLALESQAENEGWPPQGEELTFAEPLASDLIPLEHDTAPENTKEDGPSERAAKAKPALPLWEVDRFHWPRTCEKLIGDPYGYLSRAGDKLLAAVQDGLRVLAVTGSRRGEGRTTLSLCLARAAARVGIQAAVMDADFARPQLATKIALEIAYGWQDAALGRIPLSEAAVKSLADNITVLPLESSAATRSLSLADPRVTATIRAAAATFELLILDLGPLGAGERIAFPPGEACPLDAAIVVRDQRFATAAESDAVGRMLLQAGLDAVGIAENFVIDEEIPATSV